MLNVIINLYGYCSYPSILKSKGENSLAKFRVGKGGVEAVSAQRLQVRVHGRMVFKTYLEVVAVTTGNGKAAVKLINVFT